MDRLLAESYTLRITYVASGLDVMDDYPDTDCHSRRYISERHFLDEFVTSHLEIDKIAECWSGHFVVDSHWGYIK